LRYDTLPQQDIIIDHLYSRNNFYFYLFFYFLETES
jgi:hypothetical protein